MRVVRAWRGVLATGAASLGGSFCWFAAFSLQSAAYVHALGQIEILVSMAIGAFVFKETLQPKEYWGIGLLTLSLVVLILAT